MSFPGVTESVTGYRVGVFFHVKDSFRQSVHIFAFKIALMHKDYNISICDSSCARNEYVLILTKFIINVHTNVLYERRKFSNEKRS